MARYPKNKRKEAIRDPRQTIYILCEGEKTEPIYLNHFRIRDPLITVKTYHSGRTDAKGIVNYARKMLQNPIFGPPNQIWCVYDVDANTPKQLIEALQISRQHPEISLFPSNPSFEIWYLYHFQDHPESLFNPELIQKLQSHYPDYAKNCDFLVWLIKSFSKHAFVKKMNQAFSRSKKIASSTTDEEICLGKVNTSTLIYQLIDKLFHIQHNKPIGLISDLKTYFEMLYDTNK
jgi:hypothetical protein